MHEDYQERRGVRNRYAAIRPVLERWQRPFSLIDIGANAGGFSRHAMKDFRRCTAVLVEKEDIPTGLITINAKLGAHQLHEFGLSEHFDVVLALSVLHHMDDWKACLEAIWRLGTHVIIEYPTLSDIKARHFDRIVDQYKYLVGLPQQPLGEFDGYDGGTRNMSLFYRPKSAIYSGAFYGNMKREVPHKHKPHEVVNGYFAKTIHGRRWINGINLWSFLQLGGGTPTRQEIAAMLPFQKGHGDIRPWNYILNYAGLHLIDPAGPKAYHPDDEKAYAETVYWILNGGDIS